MPKQSTAEELPVPKALRRRLWFVVHASGVFFLTSCVDGSQRDGFDPWHQSVSALSLGPDGWIQVVNFLLLSAVILSTVTVWRKMLAGGVGEKAVPALTAITGAGLFICGMMPQDPAPGYDPMDLFLTAPTATGLIHLLFAAVSALSSMTILLVMARRFAGQPSWRRWVPYSVIMAVLMAIFVAIYAVWSTAPTGFAGTFERLALAVPAVWTATFLFRLGKRVPFMACSLSLPPSPIPRFRQ